MALTHSYCNRKILAKKISILIIIIILLYSFLSTEIKLTLNQY